MADSRVYRVLIVDDEEMMRKLMGTFLSRLGHLCATAIDGVEALDKMKGSKIDAVVTDIKMPKMDGNALTSEISKQYPGLPVMVMTGFTEESSAITAISAGAREFIQKPFSFDEFAIRLHKMIRDSEILRRTEGKENSEKEIHDLMNELETTIKKGPGNSAIELSLGTSTQSSHSSSAMG